jgi:hypothetical protein
VIGTGIRRSAALRTARDRAIAQFYLVVRYGLARSGGTRRALLRLERGRQLGR